jgi:FxsC-like protein
MSDYKNIEHKKPPVLTSVEDIKSLNLRLEELKESERLLLERRAMYVLATGVPLQDEKELKRVQREIKEIEAIKKELDEVSGVTPPPVEPLGPAVVNLIFIAAKPDDLQIIREHNIYGQTSSEWAPFNPFNANTIESICSISLMREDLKPYIYDIDDNVYKNLSGWIRRADQLNQILICVVDPWCLFSKQERTLVSEHLDRQQYKNHAVIIPWNENDDDYRRLEKDLNHWIEVSFEITLTIEPFWFRQRLTHAENSERIATAERFQDALINVIEEIRGRMVKRGARQSIKGIAPNNPRLSGPVGGG